MPRVDPSEYWYCQLVCEPKQFPIDDDEPDRFMHCTDGAVHLTSKDGELGEKVGSFSIIVMDVESAINERASLYDLFDSSGIAWSYYEALYSGDGDLKDKVMKAIWGEDRYAPNMLILDRVVIRAEHRGHGLGLATLRALCENFRIGAGFIAMKPFPLQFESARFDASKFKKNVAELELERWENVTEKKALASLRKYYGTLGFRRVPGTEFMVRAADRPFVDPAD